MPKRNKVSPCAIEETELQSCGGQEAELQPSDMNQIESNHDVGVVTSIPDDGDISAQTIGRGLGVTTRSFRVFRGR